MKSILIISHFHSGSSIFLAKPPGLWCYTFTCWQFEHFTTNSTISFLCFPKNVPLSRRGTSWYSRSCKSSLVLQHIIFLGTSAHYLPQLKSQNSLVMETCLRIKKNRVLVLLLFHLTLRMTQPHCSPLCILLWNQ